MDWCKYGYLPGKLWIWTGVNMDIHLVNDGYELV